MVGTGSKELIFLVMNIFNGDVILGGFHLHTPFGLPFHPPVKFKNRGSS